MVNRFRVPVAGADDFRERLERARETLADRPGHLSGHVGRNVDDPELWVLSTRWQDVGSYRRALSSYEVKLTAVPVLSQAIDEPGAYEEVVPGATLNEPGTRSLG